MIWSLKTQQRVKSGVNPSAVGGENKKKTQWNNKKKEKNKIKNEEKEEELYNIVSL